MSWSQSRRLCIVAMTAVLLVTGSAASYAKDAYTIDAGHSFVTFRVNHLGIGQAHGRFNEMAGDFELDADKLASVNFTIQTGSVDTADEKRDGHLKSPDFFNAEQFPVIQFKSKSVMAHGDHYEVSGDMKMLGVTKPMTMKVRKIGEGKDPWGNYRSGWQSEFMVKRSEFGMKFMLEGLSDEVAVMVAVEGIKK